MPKIFGERDLEVMQRVRGARSTRTGSANPGKVFPTPRLCGEVPGPVPRASARGGRPCRAFLSPRRSRRPRRSSGGASRSSARAATSSLDAPARPRARARAGRPDGDRRGRDQALRAPGAAGAARADARARPAGRPDDRRLPRRRPLRPAAPPLRRDARPRDRRHGRARGRHGRELGRQGGEERRRLRPRQSSSRAPAAGSA